VEARGEAPSTLQSDSLIKCRMKDNAEGLHRRMQVPKLQYGPLHEWGRSEGRSDLVLSRLPRVKQLLRGSESVGHIRVPIFGLISGRTVRSSLPIVYQICWIRQQWLREFMPHLDFSE
jgi:hypothetical protein